MRCFSLIMLFGLSLAGCASTQQITSEAPARVIPKSKIETGIKLARIQERQGSLHKALQMYEDMHKADPKNPEVCHRLVVVYSRLDNTAKADAFFQLATKLNPDNADLYADYGYACYLRGDLNEAEQWLKTAHQMRPQEKRITGNLALVVGMQGRTQESLTFYRQILDDAEAYANVGYLLTQRGDMESAKEHYTKALTMDPKQKSSQNAVLQLAELEEAHNKNVAKTTQLAKTPPKQAVPQVLPTVAPQKISQAVPQVISEVPPAVIPPVAPPQQAVPQVISEVPPAVIPPVAPPQQAVPQVLPTVASQRIPKAVPQVNIPAPVAMRPLPKAPPVFNPKPSPPAIQKPQTPQPIQYHPARPPARADQVQETKHPFEDFMLPVYSGEQPKTTYQPTPAWPEDSQTASAPSGSKRPWRDSRLVSNPGE